MALNDLQLQWNDNLEQNRGRKRLTRDQFNADAYLAANQDVRDAGVDAWHHYDQMGGADQLHRRWAPAGQSQPQAAPVPTQSAPSAGQQQAAPPPPPPPPVQPAPMQPQATTPTSATPEVPVPQAVAQPNAAPDFAALARMSPAQRGSYYQPGAAPGAAPDFMAFANMGEAPDFSALANIGPAQRGGGEMQSLLETFARQGLETPGRLDAPLIKESLGLIDQSIDLNRRGKSRSIREEMGSRGVISPESSPWAGSLAEMEEMLSQIESQRKNELAQWAASTNAQDRSSAANIGLGVADYGRAVGRDYEDDIRARASLGLQGAGMGEDAKSRRAGLNLQAGGMSEDAARFRAAFGQNERQFGANFNQGVDRAFEDDLRARTGFNLQGGGMTEGANMNRANFGLNANQQLWGQGMDRFGALEDVRRNDRDFGFNVDRFNRDDRFRNRTFDESMAFDKERFSKDDQWRRESFFNDLGIRRDSLNQQDRQFADSLYEQQRRNKQLEEIALLDYMERTYGENPNGSAREPGPVPQSEWERLGLPSQGTPNQTIKGSDGKSYVWQLGTWHLF